MAAGGAQERQLIDCLGSFRRRRHIEAPPKPRYRTDDRRPGVTRHDLAEAMRTGMVEPLLHRFEPRPGDCILIPAGTVHAIGAGVVLAEIQQMSDATFRIHDWGRKGVDGKPRTLHPAVKKSKTENRVNLIWTGRH